MPKSDRLKPGQQTSWGSKRMKLNSGQVQTQSPAVLGAPAATQPPRVPDHELLRRIGRGSYGEVWLARSATRGRIGR
jgi:hypothetical protein